jgi:hypothetical protein
MRKNSGSCARRALQRSRRLTQAPLQLKSVAAARSTRTAASPLQQTPNAFGAVSLQVCATITKLSCLARQIFSPLEIVNVTIVPRRKSQLSRSIRMGIPETAHRDQKIIRNPYPAALCRHSRERCRANYRSQGSSERTKDCQLRLE